jgi:hypothetical protein
MPSLLQHVHKGRPVDKTMDEDPKQIHHRLSSHLHGRTQDFNNSPCVSPGEGCCIVQTRCGQLHTTSRVPAVGLGICEPGARCESITVGLCL